MTREDLVDALSGVEARENLVDALSGGETTMTREELVNALMDKALERMSEADKYQHAAHILREDLTQDEKDGTVPRGRPKKSRV